METSLGRLFVVKSAKISWTLGRVSSVTRTKQRAPLFVAAGSTPLLDAVHLFLDHWGQ
jgi:hypothetical protein